MKVLFFLLDGDTNASSRHRVLQHLPYLRENGIEPCVSRPVPERIYQHLVESSRGRARYKATFYGLFLACRLWAVLHADRFDVVLIQRDLFPFGPPLLERLLFRRNPRVVYDTDDATYLRPVFTPRNPVQHLRRFDKVAEVAASARCISVATEPIAAWARRYNANVSVVPMAVDLAQYERVQRRPAGDPVVLGWAGTAGGLGYLHSLAPVLRDLAQKHHIVVRVISGGYRRACLPGVPLEARPWRGATVLQDMKAFDIGLVPLDDTPFEQAKFPFKLLQYLALGVPAVSARVGVATSVIRDGDNGLLAGALDEWWRALDSMIVDRDLRRRLAIAGRETVAASYTIERVAPLLAEVLWYAAGRSATTEEAKPPGPPAPRC